MKIWSPSDKMLSCVDPVAERPTTEAVRMIGASQPPTPFAGPVTQNGIWSAQVVPAPGVIALFGLAGLTGRRRRD